MKRGIIGFIKDEENEWKAELNCGHFQHTRHNPPFFNRPWVETPEGRKEKLGTTLDCLRCDQGEWPEGFVAYKQTKIFTSETTPKGLLRSHNTKKGVWAKIHVTQGELLYQKEDSQAELLNSNTIGIIVPEQMHHVEPKADTSFYVAFYKKAETQDPPLPQPLSGEEK